MSKPWARRSKLALGLVVTVIFIWLFARELDAGALTDALLSISPISVGVAMACIAAGYGVRTIRWWWMLRVLDPALPVGACVQPFLASIAVNNVLPLRAGDVLRVAGFRRQLRCPAMRVMGTLIIERALDVVVLAGVLFLTLTGLPDDSPIRRFAWIGKWAIGTGLVVLAVSILLQPVLRLFARLLSRKSILNAQPWAKAALRHGANLAAALDLVRSPRLLFCLGALSVIGWACEGAAFVVVAHALQTELHPSGPWLALSAGSLATAIPSSPGYIGTFDYFVAQGLGAYGAQTDIAAAFALAVHALLWVPWTAVGILCLVSLAPARRKSTAIENDKP